MVLEKAIERIQGKEEGFTLVELLIVVAIIAILAAIAIPQFSAYRKRGYAATLNSDAKNVYTAAMAYMTDDPTSSPDCSQPVQVPGYQHTSGVSCSGTIGSTAGTFTLTGPAAWGVTTATIDYAGNLGKSMPQ